MHSKGWLVSQSVCQSVSGHKNEQFEQISSLFLHQISDKCKYILYVTYLTNKSYEDRWKASFFDLCPNYRWTKPHHKISYMYLTNNSCTKICEKQAFLISAQIIGEQNHTSISILKFTPQFQYFTLFTICLVMSALISACTVHIQSFGNSARGKYSTGHF